MVLDKGFPHKIFLKIFINASAISLCKIQDKGCVQYDRFRVHLRSLSVRRILTESYDG